MPEPNSYEPAPEPRPAWQTRLQTEESTPERWFDPASETTGGVPAENRRGLFGALVVTSLLAAILASAGTYVVLGQAGGKTTASPTSGHGGLDVKVVSESDAIVAAVRSVSPSVVTVVANQRGGQSTGSGIVYDTGGWVLTNKHVVSGASSIQVRLHDGSAVMGTLYGVDTLTDLAIVKIPADTNLVAAPIGQSSNLQVGELAIAIGSPLGVDYADSVTSGIVSALGRDVTVTSDSNLSGTSLHGLIQTDAAINAGNSGGPLVDASGHVIGITTIQADSAQGIGFAIPIDIAKPIMQQALAGEPLARPFIGISYVELNAGLAQANDLPVTQGAWVHKEDATGKAVDPIVAGSPAAKAGIRDGDIIVSIEGRAVDLDHPLEDSLIEYSPGRTISLGIQRGSTTLTLPVTLTTRPTTTG